MPTRKQMAAGGASLLLTAAALTGCSSSGGTTCDATCQSAVDSAVPSTPTPTFATYASTEAARADVCAIFARFYVDLERLTPHGSQAVLLRDFGDAHHGITQAALSSGDSRLLDDVTNLIGYVASSDFPSKGNILGAPIQTMQSDCA